jgi:predicted TIM-barrel fold metal-dependent hydrolase
MGTVDAHHHVWRVKDMPWLSGPMVPRIFGPYEPITSPTRRRAG